MSTCHHRLADYRPQGAKKDASLTPPLERVPTVLEHVQAVLERVQAVLERVQAGLEHVQAKLERVKALLEHIGGTHSKSSIHLPPEKSVTSYNPTSTRCFRCWRRLCRGFWRREKD